MTKRFSHPFGRTFTAPKSAAHFMYLFVVPEEVRLVVAIPHGQHQPSHQSHLLVSYPILSNSIDVLCQMR